MVSRDAHLGDKPTKKYKKMPTRWVRRGVATTGREDAGPGAGHREGLLEDRPQGGYKVFIF